MSDNPFAEPDDDRTVIRPVPGGRRPPPPLSANATARAATPVPRGRSETAAPAISVSPLTVAASPLLQLLARLRAMRRAPDPGVLRERAVQDLRAFERKARDVGIAMEVLRPAHYALCASIDDVVLNTPWGAASGWANQTLVATFHPGARGADLFFDQLRQMRQDPEQVPPRHRARCTSASRSASWAATGRCAARASSTRRASDTHAVIAAQRQTAVPPNFSPQWRGIAVPIAIRAAAPAGLGRACRCGGAVRRPVPLDVCQPECGLR